MSIKLSGLVSGMDTDAMVDELVSAYSKKRDKIYKKQQSLVYKQDAWKELNTKIYSFYTGTLSNMQLSSNYNLKKATSSNTDKASVTASSTAVNGTQELQIKQLAKTAYLTGEKLKTNAGNDVKLTTRLSDLGIKEGSLQVEVNGKTTQLDLKSSMTVSELQSQLRDAGLNVNFDENNSRFFISSKKSGAEGNFSITGDDESGIEALSALGLSTSSASNIKKYQNYIDEHESTLEDDSKKQYLTEYFTKQKEDILAQISDMVKDQGPDGFTDDQNALYESLRNKLSDINDVLGKSEEDKLGAMEIYYTNLNGEAPDYTDSNSEYQAVLKANTESLQYAKDMVRYSELDKKVQSGTISTDEQTRYDELVAKYGDIYNDGAVMIEGQDAIITLNGATFESNSNSFQINGLTIEAKGLTEGDDILKITTESDVDAIYDKIKGFFKEYNDIMKEMSTKYNAESAGDYEPLTEEEEEELTDKQIEKWENKLSTAALRRDSTLSSVMSAMKTSLLGSYEINGKTYNLSTFGIKTLAYFTAADNEKASYHIDGDKDDTNSAGNEDKLRAAIVSDPEGTIEFFSTLMKDVYKTLSARMAKSTETHSAFKIYNDKTMTKQYDTYQDRLDDWDDKIDAYREKYEKKFSSMEKAMANLQSKTSALSSFFGTTS